MANGNDTDQTPAGALLSKKQREWLETGGSDPDVAAHRQLRVRIRKRLLQSFLDFRLLDALPNEDAEKIYQGMTHDHARGMVAALSFIWRGSRGGMDVRGDMRFEPMLKDAIRAAEYSPDDHAPHYLAVDVSFENDRIEVSKPTLADVDLERVGQKIADGEIGDLSHAELGYFMHYYQQGEGEDFDPQMPARRVAAVGEEIPMEQDSNDEEQS